LLHVLQLDVIGRIGTNEGSPMTTARMCVRRLFGFTILVSGLLCSGAQAQVVGPQTTYESREKNPFGNRGTFMLASPKGLADYRMDGRDFRKRLVFYLDQPSGTDAFVQFAIYKEADDPKEKRLWAFQSSAAKPGEYVIYTNETGVWWQPDKWAFYDLAHKTPECSAPAAVSTYSAAATVVSSSPVLYSPAYVRNCCWLWPWCWWWPCWW
jgi:hypothetical protein